MPPARCGPSWRYSSIGRLDWGSACLPGAGAASSAWFRVSGAAGGHNIDRFFQLLRHAGCQQAFQSSTSATALHLSNTLDTISIFLMPFLSISGAAWRALDDFDQRAHQPVRRQSGRRGRGRLRRLWSSALLVFIAWRISALWLGVTPAQFSPTGGALLAVVAGLRVVPAAAAPAQDGDSPELSCRQPPCCSIRCYSSCSRSKQPRPSSRPSSLPAPEPRSRRERDQQPVRHHCA